MTLVREDEKGLYVIAGGVTARPGAVNGYAHAYRMDDGGLNAGDKVTVRHIGGTEMVKLTLPDGKVTRWYSDGPSRDRGLIEPDPKAQWDDKGLRIFQAKEPIKQVMPREIGLHTAADIERILEQ